MFAERNEPEGSGNEDMVLSQNSMRGFLLPSFAFQGRELFCLQRKSKLSTSGEYCGFIFGDKVSFEGYSLPVTY